MFKDIKTLTNFGAYRAFAWPNVADMRTFSKFNLFYGWNYSGKTTLSRLFDCLRIGKLEEPFQKATFEIAREDGTSISEKNFQPDPTIRVFNIDYVRRNLRWDQPGEGAEPVFILGEENLSLQVLLEKISKLLQPLRIAAQTTENQRKELERSTNQKLTDEARKIKQRLWSDRAEAFERPRLQKMLEELGSQHASAQLSDEQYAEESAKFSAQPLDKLTIQTLPTQVSTLASIPPHLLSSTPTGRVIESLQANPELNLWAKRGWELHAHTAGEQCSFCGNSFSSKRVNELEQHFSQEYQQQLGKLILTKRSYITARTVLASARNLSFNRGNFYTHLGERAAKVITEYQGAVAAESDKLDAEIFLLSEKEKNLFNNISYENKARDNRLQASIDSLNGIIAEHNDYGTRLAESKESARQILTRHVTSQAATAMEYFEAWTRIDTLKNEENEIIEKIRAFESEQRELLTKLDQSVKGAERINEYLDVYFGKADLRIAPNEKKRFEVRRGERTAIHLSEGEKTAISFAHFLATTEERGARIEETVVFIDDPVSSLDSNHLFGVFSLIEVRLQNCKQLFVSTHNHEFFDLLLNWRKNSKGNL